MHLHLTKRILLVVGIHTIFWLLVFTFGGEIKKEIRYQFIEGIPLVDNRVQRPFAPSCNRLNLSVWALTGLGYVESVADLARTLGRPSATLKNTGLLK